MAPNHTRPPGPENQDGHAISTRSREDVAKATHTAGRHKAGPDFAAVNAAALPVLHALVLRWLPEGFRRGNEWIARNPKRHDRRPGSFCINLKTGRWADFALSDARGGDVISLAAYLFDLSQGEAARKLAEMLGVSE